jgi:hypothetical protein
MGKESMGGLAKSDKTKQPVATKSIPCTWCGKPATTQWTKYKDNPDLAVPEAKAKLETLIDKEVATHVAHEVERVTLALKKHYEHHIKIAEIKARIDELDICRSHCPYCDGKGYVETGGMAMEDDLVEQEVCDECDWIDTRKAKLRSTLNNLEQGENDG